MSNHQVSSPLVLPISCPEFSCLLSLVKYRLLTVHTHLIHSLQPCSFTNHLKTLTRRFDLLDFVLPHFAPDLPLLLPTSSHSFPFPISFAYSYNTLLKIGQCNCITLVPNLCILQSAQILLFLFLNRHF